jgi:hypothetical protein
MLKYIKIIFFLFFKNYFLRLVHQNDSKHTKNINFSENKIKFVRNTGWFAFPNTASTLVKYYLNAFIKLYLLLNYV